MGKRKSKKKSESVSDAFSRINFLFQASLLLGNKDIKTQLSGYYGTLLKEVSKKVVEKIHPVMKQKLCQACSTPLIPYKNVSIKIKPYRKRKKDSKPGPSQVPSVQSPNVSDISSVIDNETDSFNLAKSYMLRPCEQEHSNVNVKYKFSRKSARIKHPNILSFQCKNCGFVRKLKQNPKHKIWIDDEKATVGN